MSTHELKTLNTRLAAIKEERELLRTRRTEIDERDKTLAKQQSQAEQQVAQLKTKSVVVSEHAIVRYMERVHGIDLDQLKNEIVGRDHTTLKLPNGQFGVNGHKIRVKNGVVVTVLTIDKDKE